MANYILADNQELTRLGVESIIRDVAPGTISRVANKAQLIEVLMATDEPTVVVMDYALFDFAEVEQFLVVVDRFPFTSWIVLSDEVADINIHRILYASMRVGVVFKTGTADDVREAIKAGNRSSRYICQQAAELFFEHMQENVTAKLTSTEVEIVQAIAHGKTTKEIAAERSLSIHTVNTHRKNIFKKLNINTAHEAIRYALRAGLIDTNDFYI